MPIEDVDYLYANSSVDSAVFYIDSAKRDKRFFPAANRFDVTFPQPFRYVHTIEVLDATIPNTMYNIDVNNNVLRYMTMATSSEQAPESRSVYAYMHELATGPLLSELLADGEVDALVMPAERAPPAVEGGMKACLVRTVVTPATHGLSSTLNDDGAQVAITAHRPYDRSTPQVYFVLARTLAQGGHYVIAPAEAGEPRLACWTLRRISVEAAARVVDQQAHFLTLTARTVTIEPGNYNLTTLRQQINLQLRGSVQATAVSPEERRTSRFKWTASTPFAFLVSGSTVLENIGFEEPPSLQRHGRCYQALHQHPHTVFMSLWSEEDQQHIMHGPGVIQLAGQRYVVLRCPELEDYMHGSFAYTSLSPGLALFKLGVPGDITFLRHDFTNIVRKPFHPIGKLERMSLSFELPSGEPYDFKGTNLHLLICIKYYVPVQKHKFTKSVLVPGYDPANLDLFITRGYSRPTDVQEEEHVADTELRRNALARREVEFDYSSSDFDEEAAASETSQSGSEY